MYPRATSIPALRLVNTGVGPSRAPTPSADAIARARREVAAENHSASAISADDARWAFAVAVSQSLQGGKVAALPPVSRQRLVTMATKMGLRPFDANLVIAIVQDGARSGQGALGAPVAGRLMLVRPPAAEERGPIWGRVAIAVALGAAILAALVRWVSPG